MSAIEALIPVVKAAGQEALKIYQGDFAVETKQDASPVTAADLLVDAMLMPEIKHHFPDFAIVSEEQASTHNVDDLSGAPFFLVDPIDGTKEFVNKTGEFTLNIGLIKAGLPIAGIVYAPWLGRLFIADIDGGAFEIIDGEKTPISVGPHDKKDVVAVASRSHFDPQTAAFLKTHQLDDVASVGSSLKFCTLATGEADIYPRFGPTMEWDTAAGHAVLRAAGGEVLTTEGAILHYGKPHFKNPHFFACTPSGRQKCGL